eukprot:16380-Heterococcus_DN1.PRE.2
MAAVEEVAILQASNLDAMEVEEAAESEEHSTNAAAAAAPSAAFTKFMQGFWDLASTDSPTRRGAAASIVQHLCAAGTPQKDVDYAVKRLLRGLCSSRDSARQGFAACLAETLAALSEAQ